MARLWNMEAALQLSRGWNSRCVEALARDGGMASDLDPVRAWLLVQQPASLEQAERLLELMRAHDEGRLSPPDLLTRAGGACRRDGEGASRVAASFDPRATGPLAGRS